MDTTENKVKHKVLTNHYKLSQQHLKAISPVTAEFLCGCMEFSKLKRLRAETLADHPVFNSVKERVGIVIRDV